MTNDSLLDLCAPPEGYRFVRGVWITHDVDWVLVTDTIAPLLAGVVGENPRRRYRTARAIEGADLLVLASAGRETPGPIHTWARLVTVHGRVQHAKMAVLQFQRVTGAAVVTRAFVASANVTRGGLLHNRELFVSDEVSGQSRRPSIVPDVLDALRQLAAAEGLPPAVATDLKSSLRSISDALPSRVSRARQLRHSLSSPLPLVDAVKPPGRRSARRLVMVSPGHALDGDRLVEHLASIGLVAPGVSVEIHTGGGVNGDRGGVASFSPTFVERLRRLGALVSLHVVPEVEQVGERDRRRPLHAKLVATVDSAGDVLALVGSANCSTSGWLGGNREAMVLQRSDEKTLNGLLAELGATPAAPTPVSPPPVPARESPAPPPPGLPGFEPRRTAGGDLVGPINLDVFKTDGCRIVAAYLGGHSVAVEDLEAGIVPIPERNAVLVLQIRTRSGAVYEYRFQLGGGAPERNPSIWTTDPDEPPERVDAWLTALLGDVQMAAHRPPKPPGCTGKPTSDDTYRIPLQRRLALIARHRDDLRRAVLPGELRKAMNNLLEDPVERKVAEALLFETIPGNGPLLAAVHDVARGRT